MEPVNLPQQSHPQAYQKRFVFIVGIVLLLFIIGGIFYLFMNPQSADRSGKNGELSKVTNTPEPEYSQQPENFRAISGDVILTYFLDPGDEERLILKTVDFNTNTYNEVVLPYLDEYHKDETKHGRYRVSPSGKYIARIKTKTLEIAELSDPKNIIFSNVHTVSEMIGNGGIPDMDFASMQDAMWDDKAQLYFITEVGADGVSNPFGVYTDLFIANEDGSNKRIVNDHTKDNQKYGFMKKFAYIDSVKQEIYLTGMTHGGHLADIMVIDALSGIEKQTLSEIGRTIPQFNADYSKAYYDSDWEETGSDDVYKTKIFEYNMDTKQKTLLYSVPKVRQTDAPLQIVGNYYFNTGQNKLFFQVSDGQRTNFHAIDMQNDKKIKIFLSDSHCQNSGVSVYGDYLLLECFDSKTKIVEYQFFQIPTGKRFVFYRQKVADGQNSPIRLIRIQ